MKTIKTEEYIKLAKKKEWDPNPWAVCHTNIDKDENPEKFERCVKKVKKKQCKGKDKEPDAVLTSKMVKPFKR